MNGHAEFMNVLSRLRSLHLIGVGADLIRGHHTALTSTGVGVFSLQGYGSKGLTKTESQEQPVNNEPQKIIFDYCPNLRSLKYIPGNTGNEDLQFVFDEHFKRTIARVAGQLEYIEIGTKTFTFVSPETTKEDEVEEPFPEDIPTMFPYLQTFSWTPVILGLSQRQMRFIPTLARGLHTLEISSPTMCDILAPIMTNCSRLIRLKITHDAKLTDEQVIEPLTAVLVPNLQVLHLEGLQTITFKSVLSFTQSCSNLRELIVRNCESLNAQDTTLNFDVMEKYTMPHLRVLDMSYSLLSIPLLFHIVNTSHATLERLILEQIRNGACKKDKLLTKEVLPALYALKISFHSIYGATDSIILDEFSKVTLPRLKSLSLGTTEHGYTSDQTITIDHLNQFLNNCSQLGIMEAPRCNDQTLAIISEKKHNIREINVNAELITEEGLLSLHTSARQSLEILRIMEAKLTSNDRMASFLQDCTNLTHVFINLRSNGPSNTLLKVIIQSCPRLETAILGGKGTTEDLVTSDTVKEFVRKMKFLKLLVMDICPIQADDVEAIQNECRNAGRIAPRLVMSLMTSRKIQSQRQSKCIIS
jgi:hypothetical protein